MTMAATEQCDGYGDNNGGIGEISDQWFPRTICFP